MFYIIGWLVKKNIEKYIDFNPLKVGINIITLLLIIIAILTINSYNLTSISATKSILTGEAKDYDNKSRYLN